MVEIKKSNCVCGKCGNSFLVEWELEMLDTPETGLDMGAYYAGKAKGPCPSCGNQITAGLQAIEKPVGVLEDIQLTSVGDSFDTGKTQVDEPRIFFYDR